MAAAVCRGVVRVLVYWWRRGERAAIAAAVGVPWRCRGGGRATPARRHCWGGRGAAGEGISSNKIIALTQIKISFIIQKLFAISRMNLVSAALVLVIHK